MMSRSGNFDTANRKSPMHDYEATVQPIRDGDALHRRPTAQNKMVLIWLDDDINKRAVDLLSTSNL